MNCPAMKTSIPTRELIGVKVGGYSVRGTYHKPAVRDPSTPNIGETSRIGVVFLNPGILPRAATGDSGVYWADSVAACGYPTFRFDLPGLGDSEGNLPTKVIDFQSSVNSGDYEGVLRGLTKNLVELCDLRGVVVLGFCSGAVTSLYAAANDDHVRGLILMDPYFYVQREITSRSVLSHWQMRVMRSVEDDWQDSSSTEHNLWLSLVLKLRVIQHAIKHAVLRARGQGLPGTANLPLIHRWKQVVSSQRPMLVLSSSWSKPHGGAFDYFDYLLSASDGRSRVEFEVIEGTNHNFADGAGKAAVQRSIQEWLRQNFPVGASEPGANQCSSAPPLELPHGEDATPRRDCVTGSRRQLATHA